MRRLPSLLLLVPLLLGLLAGCSERLPEWGELPRELPRELPTGLLELPSGLSDAWRDLGLPDLSGIPNLPGLEALPGLQAPPGGIVFSGPSERRIGLGERLPGTDIELVGVSEQGAEFRIAGLVSMRAVGDSLDYDGSWPGLAGAEYSARLRIYLVGDNSVRAGGVHRLVLRDIAPNMGAAGGGGQTIRFPYTGSASVGQDFSGLTYGYAGSDERGAQISGLPENSYPYFKVGDSLRWQGMLRGDIPAEYGLRMVYYDNAGARVAGTVTLTLPNG